MSRPVILSAEQIQALQAALCGRLVALSFGAGVDSTAMLVALHIAGIRPDVITFADTGGENRSRWPISTRSILSWRHGVGR